MFQHSSHGIKARAKQWLTYACLQAFILQKKQDGNPKLASESPKHRTAGGPQVKPYPHTHTERHGRHPSFPWAPLNTTCQVESEPLRRALRLLRSCSLSGHSLFIDAHEETV